MVPTAAAAEVLLRQETGLYASARLWQYVKGIPIVTYLRPRVCTDSAVGATPYTTARLWRRFVTEKETGIL